MMLCFLSKTSQKAFISSFKCLIPRAVTASGNSATLFILDKVTFLTSKKHLFFLLDIKKSNLVLSVNFTSGFILSNLIDLKFLKGYKITRKTTQNNCYIQCKILGTAFKLFS